MNRFFEKVLQVGKVEAANDFASSLSPCSRLYVFNKYISIWNTSRNPNK